MKGLEEFLFDEEGVVALMRVQEYRRALDIINAELDNYPEVTRTLTFDRIQLNAVLGNVDEALWWLQESLNKGMFYPSVLLEPDGSWGLEPLFGRSEFERLKEQHGIHYQKMIDDTPRRLVSPPQNIQICLPSLLHFMGIHVV